MHRPVASLAAFFLTGAAGLIFQVVWTRLLVLSFGYNIHSVSVVVGAFMGGLALGSYAGGWLSDRLKNPIRFYAICEILVGLFAIAASIGLQLLPEWIAGLRTTLEIPYYGFSPWVLLISLVILLPPTLLMGATLPLLSKGLTRSKEEGAIQIGNLYSINTFGAALGSVLTGFVLIAVLGIQSTLLLAAAIYLFVGVLIFLLSRNLQSTHMISDSSNKESSISSGSNYKQLLLTPILWAFSFSGFANLASEITWTRILSPFLEGSVYAFSLVLGIFLAGIASGTLAAKSKATKTESPEIQFGVSALLVGFTTGIGVLLLSVFVINNSSILPDLGAIVKEPSILFNNLLWFSVILFLPSFFMGYGFPFVARWASSEIKTLGGRIGAVYSGNTIGAVLGSFAAGFLLIPLFGAKNSLLMSALINIVIGILIIGIYFKPKNNIQKWAIPGILFAFVIALWRIPDANIIATEMAYPKQEIEKHHEGADASVTLLKSRVESWQSLNINLRPVSGSGEGLTPWMTHLPIILSNNTTSPTVLNIGLGYGHTFAHALKYPSSQVTVVELIPGVAKIHRSNYPNVQQILSNDRGRIQLGDGRAYLMSSETPFDAIIVDPTPPLYGAGAVNLYTADFFRLCHQKMSDSGFLLMRLPYSTDPISAKLVIRTALSVFPHVSLWHPKGSGFSLIAGKSDPKLPSAKELSQKAIDLDIFTDKEKRLLVATQPTLMAKNEQLLDQVKAFPIVTDDHPYLENPIFYSLWKKEWVQ